MAYHVLTSPIYKDVNKVFVFANTGLEREETYEFLDKMNNYFGLNLVYLESRLNDKNVIDYEIVKPNELKKVNQSAVIPFDIVIQKANTIPNIAQPFCSDRLKVVPQRKFAKDYFKGEHYYNAIGFRLEDMPHRVTSLQIKERHNNKIFPLLSDFGYYIGIKQVNEFWDKMPFKLRLKNYEGNCDLCWKKSLKKKVQILTENPKVADWWIKKEDEYKSAFHINHMTTKQILELTKLKQCNLFEDTDLDNCLCS